MLHTYGGFPIKSCEPPLPFTSLIFHEKTLHIHNNKINVASWNTNTYIDMIKWVHSPFCFVFQLWRFEATFRHNEQRPATKEKFHIMKHNKIIHYI